MVEDRVAALLARALDPTVRAVLEHHRPVREPEVDVPICRGCDTEDDPDAEPPTWPCSTWALIESRLGRSFDRR